MFRKTAIILALISVSWLLAFLPADANISPDGLVATSAILAESGTGYILYEQNAYMRHPADSLTKIMTLYLASIAVEGGVLSDSEPVEMTETAWLDLTESSTTQAIVPGQTMTFIDLMYSAYVGSANEACNMIALRLAGSIDAFVSMMNDKAAELGLSDTNFVNAHGQYHENQYTTAYDMYILYNEAAKNRLFSEISGTYRHVLEREEETVSRTLVSSNHMLNQNSNYYYRYCMSGIASATYEGGYSLVAAALEEDLSLISVVLGSRAVINDDSSTTMLNFTETHRLLLWGYANFGWRDILKTTDLLTKVPILHGSGADYVNARPEQSLTLLLNHNVPDEAFQIDFKIYSEETDTPLAAPIEAGDKLGEVTVSRKLNDGTVVSYDPIALIANTSIELNGVEFMRRKITEVLTTPIAQGIIALLIIILVIYLILVIRYNIMRINRLRRIKNAKNDIMRQRHEGFRE
ncbi:MAG: serine hydrolase [Oscillospiraceae bacterium]|nr:serine hydrolase [Oscillospiraceae bacterium]